MVIVVFAVGILAVVQIFPRGFQVLLQTRDRSQATEIARAEIERIKSRPDQLPEGVRAIRNLGNNINEYVDAPGSDLGPTGNRLVRGTVAGLDTGLLYLGNTVVGPWQQNSGANLFRRIVGEGGRVPGPTYTANGFGGLRVLQFAPIQVPADGNPPVTVYGPDLLRTLGLPRDDEPRYDNEFFVTGADGNDVTVHLPQGANIRYYRVAFSYYSNNGGTVRRRDVVSPSVEVSAGVANSNGNYPLAAVNLRTAFDGKFSDLAAISLDSLRVQRVFDLIDLNQDFTDPYQVKLISQSMGVLLFSPLGKDVTIQRGGGSEPLTARVDYDVKDWRVMREEFRLSEGVLPQYRLALGNLRIGGMSGPDGMPNPAIFLDAISTNPAVVTAFQNASDPKADNFVIMDLATGGILAERSLLNSGRTLITVDKSLGLVSFTDADPSTAGIQGEIIMPEATTSTVVDLTGRALRVLYMTNNMWSVQLLKAATRYAQVYARPGQGEFFVGGTSNPAMGSANRIYFPNADAGRKVSIEELWYQQGSQSFLLDGQDYLIQPANQADPFGLPYIDIEQVVGSGATLSFARGYAVRGVRGASIAVRVLRNNAFFSLTDGANADTENMRRLEQWGRNWQRRTVETYLQPGAVAR